MGVAHSVGAGVVLGFAVAGCGAHAGPTKRADTPPPTAAPNVLAEMYQRYLTARTYEDHGTLVDIVRPDDGSESKTTRTAFQTVFDRATGAFRFEYTKTYERFFPPERHVIWRPGAGSALVWGELYPEVQDTDLNGGLMAMAGISGSTSRNVPSMLLGWAAGVKRDLGFVAEADGEANGTPCYRVSVSQDAGTVTLWIGRVDHALHRVISRQHVDRKYTEDELARLAARLPEEQRAHVIEMMRRPRPFVVEATIDYFPMFDREIDPTRFDFTPPRSEPAECSVPFQKG